MSLQQLSNAYLTANLSPVEVTRYMLDRIQALNPKINAIYYLDEEDALAQARAAERRYQRNESLGMFDGVPTTIKDAFPIRGMPTYRGSASTQDEGVYYDWNAPAVDRLVEAGAVVMGKNTMCDFGIIASGISSRHGVTRNPWNLSRSPGGSSSGAAACVAAGLCPATLGSDIVGSIRLPASYCGLVGLKPSYGRVPYYFPNSPTLVAGPLARNVHDVATMMDIIARPDPRDFTSLKPKRLDFLSNIDRVPLKPRIRLITHLGFGIAPNQEVVAAVRRAASLFEQHGAILEEPAIPRFAPEAIGMAEKFYRARTFTELNQALPERQQYASLMHEWTRATVNDSAEDMMQAMQRMQELRQSALHLIDGFDFLILPSTPTTAFPAERGAPEGASLFDAWCNNFLFNLTEQPALSINCGFSSEGLPIGLQIVGRRFDDLGVLQAARLFELLHGQPPGIASL